MSRIAKQVATIPGHSAGWERRAVFIAAGAAIAVLGVSGIGFTGLAAYLERGSGTRALPPGTLSRLPLEIAGWRGSDMPIDESIVRAADVDDYVSRRYIHVSDNDVVDLWIAFGVRARDLVPHRPEVCYPGAGWTLRGAGEIALHPDEETSLRARILTFVPGGLDRRPQVVLNYYIVDGQTCEDVSLLRSRAWRGQGSIGYMAQVQITSRLNPADPTASPERVVRQFATDSFAEIRGLLERATTTHPGGLAKEPS